MQLVMKMLRIKRLYIPSKKLRGFESGKLDRRTSGDFIGGNYTAVLNASTTLPELGANLETIDFQIFFDAANVGVLIMTVHLIAHT